ncbi:MAG: PTS sugar transporter subunit IIA [Lachnospiraceae bacterium]|nr:PTS sugar transporter subunit IIA [Lachnospiraceae bacterium]
MDLLKKENVQILNRAEDWKDAIRKSVMPLENGGYVEPRYKEEIISNVEKMGSYIVIAPYIALPHARPEQGVIKSQIAVTLFKDAIEFENKDNPVRLFIVLAAADNNRHLEALVVISELLQDERIVQKILNAENEEELYEYFVSE